MKKEKQLSPKYQVWVDVRRRFHLSHAQIQMAHELGMNPKRFGNKANHRQEPWKVPLPQYIEYLYRKRFGKARPDRVMPIEEIVKEKKRKEEQRKKRRDERRAAEQASADSEVSEE